MQITIVQDGKTGLRPSFQEKALRSWTPEIANLRVDGKCLKADGESLNPERYQLTGSQPEGGSVTLPYLEADAQTLIWALPDGIRSFNLTRLESVPELAEFVAALRQGCLHLGHIQHVEIPARLADLVPGDVLSRAEVSKLRTLKTLPTEIALEALNDDRGCIGSSLDSILDDHTRLWQIRERVSKGLSVNFPRCACISESPLMCHGSPDKFDSGLLQARNALEYLLQVVDIKQVAYLEASGKGMNRRLAEDKSTTVIHEPKFLAYCLSESTVNWLEASVIKVLAKEHGSEAIIPRPEVRAIMRAKPPDRIAKGRFGCCVQYMLEVAPPRRLPPQREAEYRDVRGALLTIAAEHPTHPEIAQMIVASAWAEKPRSEAEFRSLKARIAAQFGISINEINEIHQWVKAGGDA